MERFGGQAIGWIAFVLYQTYINVANNDKKIACEK
jgi:hypothetical protein